MARIAFLNTKIDNLTMNQAIEEIDRLIVNPKNAYLVTPNLDHIVFLEEDEEFRRVYDNADLILADGKPLIWISKYLKKPIVEKVSGSDMFPRVCEMAAQKGYSIYILGAAQGVAAKAADELVMAYTGLKIVGTFSPAYGFEKEQEELHSVIQRIRDAHPDILAVSLGSPKGEKFIYKYFDELNVPMSMSIGATIDFIAGNVQRAPKWMSDHGLEWLYRTMKEPGRLAKRYWKDARAIIPIIRKYKKER